MAMNVRQGILRWVRTPGRSLLFRNLTTLEAAQAEAEASESRVSSNDGDTKSVLRRLASAFAGVLDDEDDRGLYRRLSALGGTPDANLAETLDEWVSQGKPIKKYDVMGIVNQLRKFKKYKHAIQVLEWLEKSSWKLSHGTSGIYLDLLWKAEGIDSAEKYFESLPEKARNRQTYGALLHCYCKGKRPEKAMTLLEKMKELDYISSSLVYNNLMSLLISVGEPEKVPPLTEEMKNKGITPNFHTYNFLMNSYASLKDIESVERVLEEMEKNNVKREWTNYTNIASIFVKEGDVDKANLALRKAENMIRVRDSTPYHILLSLYSQISNRDGVYRVWKSLKSIWPRPTNMNYLVMLQALFRMGDMNELETYFAEWESSCISYDIRLASVVVESYLARNMIEKAEKLCEDAIKKAGQQNSKAISLTKRTGSRTKEMFLKFYLKECQMDMALKYLEAASLLKEENAWKPSEESVNVFMKYFEEKVDIGGAENLCKILMTMDCINQDIHDSLVRIYNTAGIEETQIPQRLQEHGIVMSSVA